MSITIECPQCGQEQEDFDGFGVLYCPECGFCTHASITGDRCDLCGRIDDRKPIRIQSQNNSLDQKAKTLTGGIKNTKGL